MKSNFLIEDSYEPKQREKEFLQLLENDSTKSSQIWDHIQSDLNFSSQAQSKTLFSSKRPSDSPSHIKIEHDYTEEEQKQIVSLRNIHQNEENEEEEEEYNIWGETNMDKIMDLESYKFLISGQQEPKAYDNITFLHLFKARSSHFKTNQENLTNLECFQRSTKVLFQPYQIEKLRLIYSIFESDNIDYLALEGKQLQADSSPESSTQTSIQEQQDQDDNLDKILNLSSNTNNSSNIDLQQKPQQTQQQQDLIQHNVCQQEQYQNTKDQYQLFLKKQSNKLQQIVNKQQIEKPQNQSPKKTQNTLKIANQNVKQSTIDLRNYYKHQKLHLDRYKSFEFTERVPIKIEQCNQHSRNSSQLKGSKTSKAGKKDRQKSKDSEGNLEKNITFLNFSSYYSEQIKKNKKLSEHNKNSNQQKQLQQKKTEQILIQNQNNNSNNNIDKNTYFQKNYQNLLNNAKKAYERSKTKTKSPINTKNTSKNIINKNISNNIQSQNQQIYSQKFQQILEKRQQKIGSISIKITKPSFQQKQQDKSPLSTLSNKNSSLKQKNNQRNNLSSHSKSKLNPKQQQLQPSVEKKSPISLSISPFQSYKRLNSTKHFQTNTSNIKTNNNTVNNSSNLLKTSYEFLQTISPMKKNTSGIITRNNSNSNRNNFSQVFSRTNNRNNTNNYSTVQKSLNFTNINNSNINNNNIQNQTVILSNMSGSTKRQPTSTKMMKFFGQQQNLKQKLDNIQKNS